MSLTTVYIVLGAVGLVGALVWWLRHSAKAEQRAKDETEAIKTAKETEDALDKITGQPRDPNKTKEKLEKGDF